MEIQSWLVSLSLGGIAALIGWGFNHIVSEHNRALRESVDVQKTIRTELQAMAVAIARICGNVEKAVQWQSLHDGQDEERHDLNVAEHRGLVALIEKLRP